MRYCFCVLGWYFYEDFIAQLYSMPGDKYVVSHHDEAWFESATLHVGGAAKVAYLSMLASHVLLAMSVPVFAILLIRHGLAGRIEKHRRLARIAWPIWIYVSVTGVLIYFLLYQWNPSA